jgi:hypothetical protein
MGLFYLSFFQISKGFQKSENVHVPGKGIFFAGARIQTIQGS